RPKSREETPNEGIHFIASATEKCLNNIAVIRLILHKSLGPGPAGRHYLGNVQLSSRGRFCSRACRVPWRWRLVRAPPPSHLAPHWEADPACGAAHTRSVLHRFAG